MSKLLIYKASAGSGKTFTLASDYIIRLIVQPQAYRRILAVTFTNKATAEMKERILQQLYGIWQGDPASQAYLAQIKRGLPRSFLLQAGGDDGKLTTLIRHRAGMALRCLLHDYSRFQVKTIDSFFQSVMQNVARELKLSPNFQIELDAEQVLSDSVDSLIEQLTPRSPALTQLMEYISEQIAEDKKWNVTSDVKTFAKNIVREDYMEQGEGLRKQLEDPGYIKAYRNELRRLEAEALDELAAFNERFEDAMAAAGIGVAMLKGGSTRSIACYFAKLGRREYRDDKVVNKTLADCLASTANWFVAKTAIRHPLIATVVANELFPLLEEAEETRRRVQYTVNSCRLSTQHLNKLRLLGYVDKEMRALIHRQNSFLLSNTNDLLHRLVKEGDSSFVFEKAGMEIDDVMIDEFQDTSRMQWDNFQTLLLESLSRGGHSMLVGDIKQSIYRWRNGDWGILEGLIREAENPDSAITVRTLDTNYRSQARVVEFNNRLFPLIVEQLATTGEGEPEAAGGASASLASAEKSADALAQAPAKTPTATPADKPVGTSGPSATESADMPDAPTLLRHAYSDVGQKVSKPDTRGYVKATILKASKEEEFCEEVLKQLGEEIEQLIEAGVKPGDMAILFRWNKHIATVADYIDRELRLPVVSDEAFQLDASPAVCLIIDALRCLADKDERIACANMAATYWQLTHPEAASEPPPGETADRAIPWDALFTHPDHYLPPAFAQQADRLRLMPLYDMVEELITLFDLHHLPGQEAYLLALLDAIGDYLTRKPSNLSAFIQHWDDALHKQPIAGGEAEGIRLLTIHKAKGLEFHTVFLPHCDWSFLPRTGQLLWCHPAASPYNNVSLVPVGYSSTMAQSVYAGDYHRERLQTWVDNLNLLYVALTRASHNLLVWGYVKTDEIAETDEDKGASGAGDGSSDSPDRDPSAEQPPRPKSRPKSGGKPELTAGTLLAKALPLVKQDEGRWDGMQEVYLCGTPCPSATKKEQEAQQVVNRLSEKPQSLHVGVESTRRKVEFRQSNRSARFIAGPDEPTDRGRMMARGSLLHALFADIATRADVEPALQRLVSEGILIRPEEVEEVHSLVQQALAQPQAEDWYSGRWTLHREQSITWMEDGEVQTRRPDRVMTRGEETVVVDFKFGRPHEQYAHQVREYLQLLVRMGRDARSIRGYLWYVEQGRIDEVKL